MKLSHRGRIGDRKPRLLAGARWSGLHGEERRDTLKPFEFYAAELALTRTTRKGPAIIREFIDHPSFM